MCFYFSIIQMYLLSKYIGTYLYFEYLEITKYSRKCHSEVGVLKVYVQKTGSIPATNVQFELIIISYTFFSSIHQNHRAEIKFPTYDFCIKFSTLLVLCITHLHCTPNVLSSIPARDTKKKFCG